MRRQVANKLVAQLAETRSGNARADVLEELRRLILTGDAPPGSPIHPGQVADVFGVSPIPVREALKTLVGEGLVTHRRNAGYIVEQLSLEELKEIYFVRGVLEQAALGRAVERISEADIDRAEQCHAQLVDATEAKDGKAFHRVSRQFHTSLTQPCDMPRLLHMFDATWNLTEPFQVMRTVPGQTQRLLNEDHGRLIQALRDRDREATLEIARIHHERIETAIIDTAAMLGIRHD